MRMFSIISEVHQGCILLLFLFLIIMDYIMRNNGRPLYGYDPTLHSTCMYVCMYVCMWQFSSVVAAWHTTMKLLYIELG